MTDDADDREGNPNGEPDATSGDARSEPTDGAPEPASSPASTGDAGAAATGPAAGCPDGDDPAAAVAAAVDPDRLLADLEATAEFGAVDADAGRGRTVLTGSDADRAAREYLRERMAAAGLDVAVDAVGNVVGRWTPQGIGTGPPSVGAVDGPVGVAGADTDAGTPADPAPAPVGAGSHLDSVPRGGIYDGPLGVYAALEAVRAMRDAGVDPGRPVEVVSFTEEEGTRFAGLLGSSVAAGDRPVGAALDLTASVGRDGRPDGPGDGETLRAALDRVGAGTDARDADAPARLRAERWAGWLELHVEQDTRLEAAGVPVGVVTEITGIAHYRARITGEADHAGTTGMGERTDALAAAAEVIRAVERAAHRRVVAGDRTAVGTVGTADVAPGATNVVPGAVEIGLDLRSVDPDSLSAMLDRTRTALDRVAADRGVRTELERDVAVDPTPMADRARRALAAGADAAGVDALELHSGAAHDTMNVARVADAGMLFAPSEDGASHSPREYTAPGDCADATRALAAGLYRLAADGD